MNVSRHSGAATLLAAICLAVLTGCAPGSDALDRFERGPADLYFTITLGDDLIGRIHEMRLSDDRGAPVIRTLTTVDLPGAGRLVMRDERRFDERSPHAQLERTRWRRGPDGRIEQRSWADEDPVPRLADFLGGAPGDSGADIPADPVAAGPNAAPAARSVLRDPSGDVLEYRIGASFTVRRSETRPRLPAPVRSAPLRIPLAAERTDFEHLDRLVLRIDGAAAALFEDRPGLRVEHSPGHARLHLSPGARPESATASLAARIIDVVHGQLDYVAGASPGDLEAVLERRQGDCHEFALLFDALARAEGLDTDIVTGLAWSPADPGALVPHAWNVVRSVDSGTWVVDPTWRRISPGADRVPFPAAPHAQLDLQAALRDARVRILFINDEPPIMPVDPGAGP